MRLADYSIKNNRYFFSFLTEEKGYDYTFYFEHEFGEAPTTIMSTESLKLEDFVARNIKHIEVYVHDAIKLTYFKVILTAIANHYQLPMSVSTRRIPNKDLLIISYYAPKLKESVVERLVKTIDAGKIEEYEIVTEEETEGESVEIDDSEILGETPITDDFVENDETKFDLGEIENAD